MTQKIPDPADEALDSLLKTWKLDDGPHPGFGSSVWRRIEGRRRPTLTGLWNEWLDTLLAGLARPSMAVACVALLLTLGAAGGWVQARQERDRISETVGVRYVQTVDPYRMPLQR